MSFSVKDIHLNFVKKVKCIPEGNQRENAPSNKTQAVKTKYHWYRHLGSWYIKSTIYDRLSN